MIRLRSPLTTALLMGLGLLSGFQTPAQAERSISVDIVADDGYQFPTYPTDSKGVTYRSYLQAEQDSRYGIRVKNHTRGRIGLVIAVDGRNIITGDQSQLSPTERMYVLEPHATATYDGWRTATNTINRFYFTDAGDSYAEAFGDSSAMGVIAVVAFEEKDQPRPYQEEARPSKPSYSDRDSMASRMSPKSEAPAPAASAKARSRVQSNAAESAADEAGTGYGEKEHSPSVRVEFSPQKRPLKTVLYKYEWKETLCRKEIIRCGHERPRSNRLWQEDDNFAPPPPRRY